MKLNRQELRILIESLITENLKKEQSLSAQAKKELDILFQNKDEKEFEKMDAMVAEDPDNIFMVAYDYNPDFKHEYNFKRARERAEEYIKSKKTKFPKYRDEHGRMSIRDHESVQGESPFEAEILYQVKLSNGQIYTVAAAIPDENEREIVKKYGDDYLKSSRPYKRRHNPESDWFEVEIRYRRFEEQYKKDHPDVTQEELDALRAEHEARKYYYEDHAPD